MTEKVKLALIAAAVVLGGIWLYSYSTPYQSCVRAVVHAGQSADYASIFCAKGSN
jgi:hypothetical protein